MALFLKKNQPYILLGLTAFCAVIAALVLLVLVPRADAVYRKVLGIIIGILFLVLCALIGGYYLLTRDKDPNFFLFDRQRKRNIPIEELSFKLVNERMNFFLTLVCDSEEQLWSGEPMNILENERNLGQNLIYRPLLAYKMVYDLADKNTDEYWSYLEKAPDEVLDSLFGALEQGGETEMVKAFRYVMANCRGEMAKVKNFVCGNEKYIRGRMLVYIKRNVDQFY